MRSFGLGERKPWSRRAPAQGSGQEPPLRNSASGPARPLQPRSAPTPALVSAPSGACGCELQDLGLHRASSVQSRETARVLYNERMIEIEVIGPNGKTLPRWTNHALTEGFVPPARSTLPRNGLTGGVVDLTCASPVNESPQAGAARGCTWKYTFAAPGSYRLVGHYSTIPDPVIASPRLGVDYLRIESDTVILVVGQATG